MRTIVSLTSYGERLSKTLPHALESIAKMDGLEPDMIVLYLTESDYEKIDKNLFVKHPNLTARITDDIKSYKKYIALTEREFDDDIVFITDDDVSYKPDTYANLNKEYTKHPEQTDTVYATWCKAFDSRDELFVADRYHVPKDTKPNRCFVFCSGWGVLVPPRTMRLNYDILKDGYEYGNQGGQNYISDDKLMSAYCKANDIRCVCVYSVQRQIKFDGDTPLYKARVGKSNVHAQLAMRFFNSDESDTITVSLSPTRLSADRIESLFTKQTLTPDRVVITLKPDTKVSDKLKSLTSKHNIDIQYDDSPASKRWCPDNTDPNELLVIMDDTDPDDTVESLFAKYYESHYGYIGTKRMAHVDGYGHKPIIDTEHCAVRAGHTGIVTPDTTPVQLTRNILANAHTPKRVINNP